MLTNGKSVTFSRHAQTLLYESFLHAQGDQVNQIHFIQSYARLLYEQGMPFDVSVKHRLTERIRNRHLPQSHKAIPNPIQVRAQFEYWWLNMFDIFESVYAADPGRLPDDATLYQRMVAVGGDESMSSFTAAELSKLTTNGFSPYRTETRRLETYQDVVHRQFLPNLIRVELNFQGHGAKFPERPRTDDGDVHESRMLGHCVKAARRDPAHVDTVDRIYLTVRLRLDWLERHNRKDPTYLAYQSLKAAYNDKHPTARVASLHKPEARD